MNKKSKIFFLIFGLLIAGSIVASYYKYMVKRDYVIEAQADCDPTLEKCFVHVCDPDPEVDGECTGDLTEDTWYTKNISRMAYNIPNCDPSDEECTALTCDEGEADCSYTFCDETNVPDGDTCNDPETYNLANPVEEETDESEEGVEADETEEGAAEGEAIDQSEYYSDALGFSVEYPTSWKMVELPQEIGTRSGIVFNEVEETPNHALAPLAFFYYDNIGKVSFSSKLAPNSLESYMKDSMFKNAKAMTFNEEPAFTATLSDAASKTSHTVIFVSHGGHVYEISYDNISEDGDVIRTVISTLRFDITNE